MVAANPIAPRSTNDARATARESGIRLAAFADRDLRVRIDGLSEPVTPPAAAVAVLVDALGRLADGGDVAAEPDEYTVSQAARLLGVSDAYVVRELDAGPLPAAGAGVDRRIRRTDLTHYDEALNPRQVDALNEMVALDEEGAGTTATVRPVETSVGVGPGT